MANLYLVRVYGQKSLRQVTAPDIKAARKIAKQRYGVIRHIRQANNKAKAPVLSEHQVIRITAGRLELAQLRILELEEAFLHYFKPSDNNRFCADCGLYLTDNVHNRAN